MSLFRNLMATGAVVVGTSAFAQNYQDQPAQQPRPITSDDINAMRNLLVDQRRNAVLTRDNIGALRDRSLDSQFANGRPGYAGQDQPMPRRRKLTTSPKEQSGAPARIYLGQGIVSAISFFDKTGRPWPIEEINFDPGMLMVNSNGCGESQEPRQAEQGGDRPHVIYVMPCKYWTFANVIVKLEKVAAPLMYQIESGTDEKQAFVDMAIDISVDGKSPAGRNQIAMAGAAAGAKRKTITESFSPDDSLDDFLNAVPPQAARQIRVSGAGETTAWIYQGALYLKTAGVVMNPAHDAMGGPYQGAYVWRFDRPVPRILTKGSDGIERYISLDY